MIVICRECNRYKFLFEMIDWWLGEGTCKECAKKLYAITDVKIKRAFGI
jgi:hypothetical protein